MESPYINNIVNNVYVISSITRYHPVATAPQITTQDAPPITTQDAAQNLNYNEFTPEVMAQIGKMLIDPNWHF